MTWIFLLAIKKLLWHHSWVETPGPRLTGRANSRTGREHGRTVWLHLRCRKVHSPPETEGDHRGSPEINGRNKKPYTFLDNRRENKYAFFITILPCTHFLHAVALLVNSSDAEEALKELIKRYGTVLKQFDRGVAIDTQRNTDEILGRQC